MARDPMARGRRAPKTHEMCDKDSKSCLGATQGQRPERQEEGRRDMLLVGAWDPDSQSLWLGGRWPGLGGGAAEAWSSQG